MTDESRRTRIVRMVMQAVRWRPSGNRQIWLVVLALEIVICCGAIAIPSQQGAVLSLVLPVIVAGYLATESRKGRREREELAARLAAVPSDDFPADVIALVAAGKKIQAIKRYRDLTGVSLQQAKAMIDSL